MNKTYFEAETLRKLSVICKRIIAKCQQIDTPIQEILQEAQSAILGLSLKQEVTYDPKLEVQLSEGGGYILFLMDGREIYYIQLTGRTTEEIRGRINDLAWKRWATPEVIDQARRLAKV